MAENSRKKKAFKIENRLRVALYYSFQLLVDVIILYAFIKAFSMSYDFAHDIFYDSAKNLKNKDYVVVKIEPDSSTNLIANQIYDAGVIKNKYVLMARIKITGAGGDIKAGTYSLSQSMTYNEIIKIITNGVSVDMDEKKKSEEKKVDTPTDAMMIHNNSDAGAGGGGAAEGEVGPAEDGGDSGSGSGGNSESGDNGGDSE